MYRDPYEDDKELDEADFGDKLTEENLAIEDDDSYESVVDDEDDEEEEKKKDDKDNEEDLDDGDSDGEGDDEGGDEDEESDESDKDDSDESEDGEDDADESDEEEGEEGEGHRPSLDNAVPQGRFNEVNARAQRAEERAERLEALLGQALESITSGAVRDGADDSPPEQPLDVAAAEKEFLELAFAGKEDEAIAKRLEIDEYKEQQLAKKYGPKEDLNETVAAAIQAQHEETNLKSVIDATTATYPQLKEGDPAYDQSLVDEINAVWDGFSLSMAPSQALEKAVALVTTAKGMSPAGDESAPKPKPKSNSRKKAAVKKNADAQNKQPPTMRGRSAKDDDLDQLNPSKLSDKKLFSMSEKELKRLRGD